MSCAPFSFFLLFPISFLWYICAAIATAAQRAPIFVLMKRAKGENHRFALRASPSPSLPSGYGEKRGGTRKAARQQARSRWKRRRRRDELLWLIDDYLMRKLTTYHHPQSTVYPLPYPRTHRRNLPSGHIQSILRKLGIRSMKKIRYAKKWVRS